MKPRHSFNEGGGHAVASYGLPGSHIRTGLLTGSIPEASREGRKDASLLGTPGHTGCLWKLERQRCCRAVSLVLGFNLETGRCLELQPLFLLVLKNVKL